jgi:glycine cleavage system aminomethyltransferase T
VRGGGAAGGAFGFTAHLRCQLTHFKWLTGQEITVAGVNYVGELGWELHAPMEDLPKLYSAIEETGRPMGLVDFGTYAVNAHAPGKSL